MKNNKYYGVIDGIGYAVSRPIKRKYYAFLLRNADDRISDWRAFSSSGELVKNFYKIQLCCLEIVWCGTFQH